MKICVDCRLITAPGIGRYLKSLLPHLAIEKRFTLILLCHKRDKESLVAFGKLVFVKSPIYSLGEQLELSWKIPVCELFWSPHFNVPLLPIRAKTRLTTIHDVYHLAFFSKLSWPEKCYAKVMYQSSALLSDCIVTVSEFTAKEIRKYLKIQSKKIVVIPNGITATNKRNLRKKFILAVGNMKPHKNLERLRQAVKQLGIELIIVGKGYHEVTDEKLASLYSEASLLVFPSLYEGFGYPPLEAMAAGCPVVASDRGSIPEVCGNAVEYINPYDVESIKKGIEKVLYNKIRADELVELGFSQVKKYSLSNTLNEHLKLLNFLTEKDSL